MYRQRTQSLLWVGGLLRIARDVDDASGDLCTLKAVVAAPSLTLHGKLLALNAGLQLRLVGDNGLMLRSLCSIWSSAPSLFRCDTPRNFGHVLVLKSDLNRGTTRRGETSEGEKMSEGLAHLDRRREPADEVNMYCRMR